MAAPLENKNTMIKVIRTLVSKWQKKTFQDMFSVEKALLKSTSQKITASKQHRSLCKKVS